jgi:excisionase family DNA binding protein
MKTISTKQVAQRLGVSVRRIQAMITAGRLPAEKFAGVWMIKEKDLGKVGDRRPGRPSKRS